VSFLEDQTYAANAAAKAENHNAELEHRLELSRQRLTEEAYRDPRVCKFKERRSGIAGQLRWWKPNDALPKKRRF
jgi:hypothetical protein